jgi:hypothetical protein
MPVTDNIVKFYPPDACKDPDVVLELCKGEFLDVFVVGYDNDGNLHARCSLGLQDGGNMLWLLECAKTKLMTGDFSIDGAD